MDNAKIDEIIAMLDELKTVDTSGPLDVEALVKEAEHRVDMSNDNTLTESVCRTLVPAINAEFHRLHGLMAAQERRHREEMTALVAECKRYADTKAKEIVKEILGSCHE